MDKQVKAEMERTLTLEIDFCACTDVKLLPFHMITKRYSLQKQSQSPKWHHKKLVCSKICIYKELVFIATKKNNYSLA